MDRFQVFLEQARDFRDFHLLVPANQSNYSMVFNADLWDWNSILNPYEFEWNIGTTPMSNLGVVTYAWTWYFAILMMAKFMVRGRRDGLSIKWISALHNLVLCVASVIMFLAALFPLIEILTEFGFDAWCSADKTSPRDGPTYWPIYVFYLSKYYELLDTLILVLRKVFC